MNMRGWKRVPFSKMLWGSGYRSAIVLELEGATPDCTGSLFCSDIANVNLVLSEQNECLWFSVDFLPPGYLIIKQCMHHAGWRVYVIGYWFKFFKKLGHVPLCYCLCPTRPWQATLILPSLSWWSGQHHNASSKTPQCCFKLQVMVRSSTFWRDHVGFAYTWNFWW